MIPDDLANDTLDFMPNGMKPPTTAASLPRPETVEEIYDFDLPDPKRPLDVDIAVPVLAVIPDDVWPEDSVEYMPDQPGKDNVLNIEMPPLLETVPGEPRIGKERIITQDEDTILLEYEIEFPKPADDEKPFLPGSNTCEPPPRVPDWDVPLPDIKNTLNVSWPNEFPERARQIGMPPTIYDTGKPVLGKAPKPLKPKGFQKVLNTIPMPHKIKNVPAKPITEPRNNRQPNQSPPRRPVIPEIPPERQAELLPVRFPEKNQIAL